MRFCSPALTIRTTLHSLQALLCAPEPGACNVSHPPLSTEQCYHCQMILRMGRLRTCTSRTWRYSTKLRSASVCCGCTAQAIAADDSSLQAVDRNVRCPEGSRGRCGTACRDGIRCGSLLLSCAVALCCTLTIDPSFRTLRGVHSSKRVEM